MAHAKLMKREVDGPILLTQQVGASHAPERDTAAWDRGTGQMSRPLVPLVVSFGAEHEYDAAAEYKCHSKCPTGGGAHYGSPSSVWPTGGHYTAHSPEARNIPSGWPS